MKELQLRRDFVLFEDILMTLIGKFIGEDQEQVPSALDNLFERIRNIIMMTKEKKANCEAIYTEEWRSSRTRDDKNRSYYTTAATTQLPYAVPGHTTTSSSNPSKHQRDSSEKSPRDNVPSSDKNVKKAKR